MTSGKFKQYFVENQDDGGNSSMNSSVIEEELTGGDDSSSIEAATSGERGDVNRQVTAKGMLKKKVTAKNDLDLEK